MTAAILATHRRWWGRRRGAALDDLVELTPVQPDTAALRAVVDLDALAGGPGRAEDLSLKLAYDINERWTVTGGYRTVEGGADTDEVYNFAWFHSAVVSAVVRF